MKNFKDMEILTKQELIAYIMLKQVKHNSIYGAAIKEVCAKPEGLKIRALINELRTEAPRGSNGLKALLGPAYPSVTYK